MISRDFINFALGIRPKPAQKQHRTAKPGTIGAMSATQIKELVSSSLGKVMPGASVKTRPELKFKGIQSMESREALQLLLGMSAQERADVLAALDKIQKTATAWGMIPADLIELIK